MKNILLTFIFIQIQILFAKDPVLYVENFDCVEVAGTIYTGSPGEGRFNRDGRLIYEYDDPIILKGIGEPDYSQAKKLVVTYWDEKTHKFKHQNVMGALKKAEKRFPLIGRKEKKPKKNRSKL